MTDELNEYSLYKALCRQGKLKVTDCSSVEIQKLLDKGLYVEQINDHYELQQSITPLNSTAIKKHLENDILKRIIKLIIKYQVNSTNESIHDYKYNQGYLVMLAEYQRAGKGRRVKQWSSPLASNIYLSIKFNHSNKEHAHFVPLMVALAVCKGLKQIGIKNCMIKWPNDIYLDGKKVAGILVENRYNSETGNTCVVGIGINVNMRENRCIDQNWTSLAIEENCFFDRNAVSALLLSQVILQCDQLNEFDVTAFIRHWNEIDYLKGKPIKVSNDKINYDAIATGLSKDGSLKINVNGKIQNIYSAEVSVVARA